MNRHKPHFSFLWLAFACAVASSSVFLRPSSVQATASGPVAATAPTDCPLRTEAQWQSFLERYADNEKWVETCEDAGCDEQYSDFVKNNVQRVLESCAGFIAQHEGIKQCTANYRRFVPAWIRQHDGESYGFDVPNSAYLADQEAPDKPKEMMKVPDALVQALPDRKNVEEAARKNGYKYLTHDSAIDGLRTFVLVSDPKGRFDQWLLLNLQAGKESAASTTMPLSVIAVQKKDAKGTALPKVRLHFRDYDIGRTGDRFELHANEEGNGKCYACHASGVRQLIPRRTPVLEGKPARGETGFDEAGTSAPADFAFSRLVEFNQRLRSYGQPDWDGKINPGDHGPALGRAQGCVDCHDGKSRGVLNISTSTVQLEKKIHTELSMPPDTPFQNLLERHQMKNPNLLPEEEKALKKAFATNETLMNDYMDSRLPELKRWLLETPCRL